MRSSLFSSRVRVRVLGLSVVAGAALLAACSAPDPGGSSSPIYSHPGAGSGSGSSSGGAAGSGSGSSSGGNGATGSSSGGSSGSSSGSGGGPSTTISADETWADGKQIASSVTIAAGVTVTVAPGATITIASGAITVAGTLKATTSATHAKLTGTTWAGVVIAKGGTLTADSLDVVNATVGLDVSGVGTFSNGLVTAAGTPLQVEIGGSLTLTKSNVVGAKGQSNVKGTLIASHMDYDSNGMEGIALADPTAVLTVDDSTFHGTSVSGGDMIVASGAKSIHLAYSEIKGCHCAFHFNNVESFDIANMNVHADSYGFMMYGSSPTAGTRTVKSSNFLTMAAAGIDENGTNGAITVDGCYFDTASKISLKDQQVTVSNAATAAVPSVGPRL